MKKISLLITIAFSMLLINCSASNPENVKKGVVHLTNETFKKDVYNYELNKQWKFEGKMPAIIDFYADWCGPCRKMAPIIDEIAVEYGGKIKVYKVDTDVEKMLSQTLGITGLPTLLFIPANGNPQVSVGLLDKATIVKAINDVLLTN
jgi:thioredoxin 1